MRAIPHAHGYTLTADAFMRPVELVGFFIVHQLPAVSRHFHDFYELALVLGGTGHHITDLGSEPVSRGTVMFIAPGVSHGYEHGDSLVVYNCFLRREAALFDLSWAQRDDRLGRLFASPDQAPRVPIVVRLDEPTFLVCVEHLEAIRERPSADRGEAFDLGHLLLALDLIARQVAEEQLGTVVPTPGAPPSVRSALALIEEDLTRHWALDALAGEIHVDAFHLVRLFTRWIGLPPVAYANRRRADRAAVLLSATDDAIADIGARVGWPDPSTFARRFRHEFGVSPRAYRVRSRAHHASVARSPVSD